MQIGNWKATESHERLSPRELEAMLYAANDLTIKEIARKMHIEPTTVKARLDNARFKLGMQKTLRGLCMEAFKRGIIVPLTLAIAIATAAPSTDFTQDNTVNSTSNEQQTAKALRLKEKFADIKS